MASNVPQLANSITNNKKKDMGALGQIMVANFYGVPFDKDTRNFDLIINGIKVEVKSKDRTVPGATWHDASVSGHNPYQKTDIYYFVSMQRPKNIIDGRDVYDVNLLHTAYLMGYIRKSDFFTKAAFYTEGSRDPRATQRQIEQGKGIYLCDTYSMRYDQCIQPTDDHLLHLPSEPVDDKWNELIASI